MAISFHLYHRMLQHIHRDKSTTILCVCHAKRSISYAMIMSPYYLNLTDLYAPNRRLQDHQRVQRRHPISITEPLTEDDDTRQHQNHTPKNQPPEIEQQLTPSHRTIWHVSLRRSRPPVSLPAEDQVPPAMGCLLGR